MTTPDLKDAAIMVALKRPFDVGGIGFFGGLVGLWLTPGHQDTPVAILAFMLSTLIGFVLMLVVELDEIHTRREQDRRIIEGEDR